MANWYDKYMSIYGKPFSEVPQYIVDETRERLAALQSPEPLASIVVIGYNEEKHLQACLWAISEIRCKYPVEIIGVDNDSKDRTAEIYEKSGIPYYTEYQHSCGYARRCGLQHAKGRFYFDVDSDTLYPPQYYEIMLDHLLKPGVSCVSATWSYFPDENHSKLSLRLFEMARDLFLWIQHFKRPELSVRGLVFAYNADYGRQEPYRVDIIRGGQRVDTDVATGTYQVACVVKCHLEDGTCTVAGIGLVGVLGCDNRCRAVPGQVEELQDTAAVVDDKHVGGIVDGKAGTVTTVEHLVVGSLARVELHVAVIVNKHQ